MAKDNDDKKIVRGNNFGPGSTQIVTQKNYFVVDILFGASIICAAVSIILFFCGLSDFKGLIVAPDATKLFIAATVFSFVGFFCALGSAIKYSKYKKEEEEQNKEKQNKEEQNTRVRKYKGKLVVSIVCILLAVIFFIVSTFFCVTSSEETGCPPHIDSNGDGICDYCDECVEHRDLNVDGKCDHCGAIIQKPVCEHVDDNDDGECDVCGTCLEHRDANNDFICDNCQERMEPNCEPGKHIDKNDNGVCDFCDTFGHQDPSGDGKCDHCGAIIQKPVCDEHIDADDDGECDVCETCIEHRDTNNDFICDNCGEPMDPPCPPHIDNNGDGICDYCDGCMDHRDLNVDGKCDHCGAIIQKPVCDEHIDADDDGECDVCETCIEHRDTNNDFICDNCGEPMDPPCPPHIDNNGDGICDYCDGCMDHRDLNVDGKCDHCGAIIQKPVCDEHIDADDDGECDVCETCIEHRDTNNDFICDNCGEPMDPPCPPHIDNNGDGICDYCDVCMDHRDLNVDGKCDHCGITMQVCNKHIDADDDGECDRCGACMKHIDKDDDGECDRCGACMEHIDENGDWLCDRCEAELEVVVANNGLVYTVLGNGTLAVSAGEEFKGGVLEVPSEYQGRQVTAIADNGFDNQILLTSISIPEGIDMIGTNAFANCIELNSIEISQSEVRLGDDCFENCPKLQEISYVGTLEQWEMILENSEGNNKVYVNCDGPQDYLPTYIAVFYSGDEEVARVEYKYGSDRIEEPQVPERLGYDGYWEPYAVKASDIEIHAIYTLIEYTIDYEYPDGWTHDNVATYTVEDEVIILSEATRFGYHSLSWRIKSTKDPVSRIVPQEVHSDLTLEAYGDEKPIEYKIKYELNGGTFSNSTPVESVKLEELGEYGNIPLESPEGDVSFNKDGTFTVASGFNGWRIGSINGAKVTSITYDLLSKYSADGEITLHAGWDMNGPRDYLRVDGNDELDELGDYILFGRYPQQLKAEKVKIKYDSYGKPIMENGYYTASDGEYYVKVTASPYESGYTFLNGDGIVKGYEYYFKVMPIKWRILGTTNGDAMLFADNILANRAYDSSNDGNESKYADSELRAWLNNEFYNAAFTDMLQDQIVTTEVDNSAASTGWPNGNSFATKNTEDKVFVLSRQESVTGAYGFSTSYTEYDSARRKVVTDYARATGAFMNTDSTYKGCEGTGFYWLRSPYNWYGHNAHFVYFYGSSSNHYNVNTTYFGVVPAITLIL